MSEYLPLIAADPGGTTGIVALRVPREQVFVFPPDGTWKRLYDSIEIVEYLEVPEEDAPSEIFRLCLMIMIGYESTFPVVLEDFILRTRVSSVEVLSPARVNAAVTERLALAGAVVPAVLYFQQPSEAKGTVTDFRLKRWGLYRKGKPHARDALRHGVHFLRKARVMEKLRSDAWRKDEENEENEKEA